MGGWRGFQAERTVTHAGPEDREMEGKGGSLVGLGNSQTTWGQRGRPVWSPRPKPGKKFSDLNSGGENEDARPLDVRELPNTIL